MPNQSVSSAIRAELARADLQQKDLADALGVHPSQVSARLKGAIDWRLSELQTVAALLNIPLSRLVAEPVDGVPA